MTYAKSGLFWSQCFLPSLVIRKAQAGAGKSSLGLLWDKCMLLGMSRLCSATFEQLFAFGATFFGSSNFKQLFPF